MDLLCRRCLGVEVQRLSTHGISGASGTAKNHRRLAGVPYGDANHVLMGRGASVSRAAWSTAAVSPDAPSERSQRAAPRLWSSLLSQAEVCPGSPKEVAVLIMAVHQVPSLTQERYEEVVCRLTNGKSRLESPADLPFEGLLFHVAGQGRNGFCVVDVFESEEAVERFNEAMGSIPREVGIEEPPEFFPVHTFISR